MLLAPPVNFIITRTKRGRRLLGQSRRCVKRTVTLAVAYHLTGNAKAANAPHGGYPEGPGYWA